MSKADDLLQHLKTLGLLQYGAVIEREVVHEFLGVTMPALGTRAEFDAVSLAELSATGAVRDALLREGKYLAATRTGYRVLLPSENKAQIDAYMASARRKLNRAQKLNRTTPVAHNHQADQTEARILLQQEGSRAKAAPPLSHARTYNHTVQTTKPFGKT